MSSDDVYAAIEERCSKFKQFQNVANYYLLALKGFNLEYDEETHYVRSLSGHKVVNRDRIGDRFRLIADGFL
ncbi:hypothetical protein G6F46_007571 [Rhizopus delemar]|uniref:Uncharacterized protein n=2 Tax=Rhizopus TaxID=4842 RepID=A0A9P6Z1H4_9FUNG|nr:hypothetical protein G6F55_009358 [Rhizopus delemar]KAG1552724.1 hypothetical protein G6F51_001036 [Rhizopus arrhizus]KAG1499175.1 hypothetical protein G6F54_004584 [Rhizopus delemar]KAG1512594.1 hypothetical protein G6F53_005071 [Rhizopus delemar]KAG1515208.1 hypothetical protein G6F52_009741 [Rhizopus delemar]